MHAQSSLCITLSALPAVWQAALWRDPRVERGRLRSRLVCGQPPCRPGWAALPGAGGVRLLLPAGVLPGSPADLRPPGTGHPQVITPPATKDQTCVNWQCTVVWRICLGRCEV